MADTLNAEAEVEVEESRTEAVTVKVSLSTLRSLQLVATVHNRPLGPQLFDRSIREIEREAEQIRAKVCPVQVAS